jgi:uncharacterized protein
MLLSKADITRLEKCGHNRDSFARFDAEGYVLLRNHQGHCVFYSQADRQCAVYAFRPSGCRVYPVIFDEENGVVVDSICHAQNSIAEDEKMRRGKRVVKLLEKIDAEAQTRRSK